MDEQKRATASKGESDASKPPFWWDAEGFEIAFVNSMKALRLRKMWSQTYFAQMASKKGLPFHQPTVARIEAGQRPVKISEAFVIAELFGTTFAAMTEGQSLQHTYRQLVDESVDRFMKFVAHELNSTSYVERRFRIIEDVFEEYVALAHSAGVDPDPELLAWIDHVMDAKTKMLAANEAHDEAAIALATALPEPPKFNLDYHGDISKDDEPEPDDRDWADYEAQQLIDERRGK